MNNWTEEAYASLVALEYTYLIIGKEIAPTTGTPHLQCFVIFKNARYFKAALKDLPGCHVAESQGSPQQNIDYCSAQGKWLGKELWISSEAFGTPPPGSGSVVADKWDKARSLAKEGKYDDIDSEIYIKHFGNLKRIRAESSHSPLPEVATLHKWFYGDSGTGKSRAARDQNPGAFVKPAGKWWDGYTNQSTVIIDDVDREGGITLRDMKTWADHYPFQAEIKGGVMEIRPTLIVVTSNYHPKEIWESEKEHQPIIRRFDCVHFLGQPTSCPLCPAAKTFNHPPCEYKQYFNQDEYPNCTLL